MFPKNIISFFIVTLVSFSVFSQKDSLQLKDLKVDGELKMTTNDFDPLSPSKAAFYSVLLPGAGQIYNRKYWKAPIVWGALATSIYLYLDNNSAYKRYRRAFKLREAGFQDEFTLDDGSTLISATGLTNAQRVLRKNRDLSLFSTVIIYALQIIEASVNAHLLQFNTNDNLTFEPTILQDPMNFDAPKVGLVLTYNF